MQHGLLAIALALIAAIVAALFAPAYVNWNDWRTTFERQASDLAGTQVRIRGPIEATILPTPAFVLRDVRIGDPEKSTGIHAGEARGTLSLGALLRGAFEAEEFVLQKPAIRIAVERGGRIVLPESGGRAPDALAISRFSIEGGSLTVDDRASGSLAFFDAVSASGELQSRTGPMRLDANMRLDGRRWNLRASTGVFGADGAARTRLLIERPDDATSLDADGLLGFAASAPRFQGKLNLAQQKAPGLPWRIAAQTSANGDLVSFDTMELTLGSGDLPLELSGNLQFTPRSGGDIKGTLSAKRLDLDRVLAAETGKGLVHALSPLRTSADRFAELPFNGRIGFSVDLLVTNGAQLRELSGEIALRNGIAGIGSVEAKLPGRALLQAKSTGAGTGYFSGDVLLEADEPAALIRWALGPEKADTLEDAGALRIGGRAEWTRERIAAERLDFQLGDAKLGGNFSFNHRGERGALRTALTSNGVDLDLLRPLAETFWQGSKNADVSFGFTGQALKLFGKEMKRVDAQIVRDAKTISFDRLGIDDFDGLSLKASGGIADNMGRIAFDLDAARTGGLAALAAEFGGEDFRALAEHLSQRGLPMKLSGFASGDGSKLVTIEAAGRMGGVNANITARVERETATPAEMKLTLEAGEAGRLLSLIGISPGLPAPGDGRLEVRIGKAKAGAAPLEATLSVPGADLSGTGALHLKDGKIEPRLALKLEASDLRPAIAAVSRARSDAVGAKGSAALSRAGEALRFDNLSLELGGTRITGALSLAGLSAPVLGGNIAVERAELTELLALLLGSSGDSKPFWPSTKLAAAPLAGASGTVDVQVSALGLSGAQVATHAKASVKLGTQTEISGFSADYAGGKLSGDARISRGETISLDGRVTANGFDIARVLVPGTWKANARGRGSLTLSLSGSGATPAALAARLSGQGTLALENLEIDNADPLSIGAVVSAAEKFMPKDESALIAGVNKMLARAPLKVAKLETPLVAASGSLKTGKAIAKAGDVDVTAEASIDLARLNAEGAIELETSGLTSARPGVTLRWRGPLASPSRSVDVSALSTAINLRAMERETKRLEQRDRSELPSRVQ